MNVGVHPFDDAVHKQTGALVVNEVHRQVQYAQVRVVNQRIRQKLCALIADVVVVQGQQFQFQTGCDDQSGDQFSAVVFQVVVGKLDALETVAGADTLYQGQQVVFVEEEPVDLQGVQVLLEVQSICQLVSACQQVRNLLFVTYNFHDVVVDFDGV